MNHLHVVINDALALAVERGYALQNAARLVRAKPGVTHKERHPYSLAEVRTFLQTVREHRLSALFQLLITTGMRESELLGLAWDNVDWDQGEVRIRRQLKYGHEREGDRPHFWLDSPKTETSRRIVPLIPPMVEALRQHQERQRFEQKRLEALGVPRENRFNLVFVTLRWA